MDKDTIILILPDSSEHYAVLASSSGQIQVFEIPENVAAQALADGISDYVGMSLKDITFEAALAEISHQITPVDIAESVLVQLMLNAVFRFMLQKVA